MSKAPDPRLVALPDVTRLKRVGRLRLGESEEKTREDGSKFSQAKKLDYIRVDGEDGLTSPESAASFHLVYGDQPKRLTDVRLPGATPSENLRGGWRFYGQSKLKRQCDGETCDERSDTGGWVTIPCACKSRKIDPTTKAGKAKHCAWVYTLELVLPDVQGVGVWDLATSSQVSVNRLTTSMETLFALRGDLRGIPLVLEVFPVKVSPLGRTETIYAVDLTMVGASPAELMAADYGQPVRAELPPPAIDVPDALLHPQALELEATTTEGGGASTAGASESEAPAPGEPLHLAVERQIEAFTPHQDQVVLAYCKEHNIQATRDGFIEAWGERARNIAECIGATTHA